jgi:uncharacterized protein YukE
MADVKILIEADASGAIQSIKQVSGEVSQLGSETEKTDKKTGGFTSTIASGILTYQLATKALRAVVDVTKQAMAAAAESESVDRALQTALETTGRSTAQLFPQFNALSQAIQQETTISDEAARSAMTLLVQMTNLDRRGIEQATKSAIGLSKVYGMDLDSAIRIVQKAVNGQTAMLQRYGIQIDSTLPLEEKRAAIFERLSPLYQRAQSETETYSGAMAQLKNTIGDSLETIGLAIIKNEDFAKLIKDVNERIKTLTSSSDFKLWASALAEMLTKVIKVTEKAFTTLSNFINQTTIFFAGLSKTNKQYDESVQRMAAALERARAAGHYLKETNVEVAASAQAATEAINETGNVAIVDEEAKKRAAAAAKKLAEENAKLAEAVKKVRDQLDPTGAKIRALEAQITDLVKAQERGLITTGEASRLIAELRREIESLRSPLQALPKEPGKLGEAIRQMVLTTRPMITDWTRDATDRFKEWVDKVKEEMSTLGETFDKVFSGLNSIFAQSQRNREIAIENEYKRRLQTINATIKDETRRARAVEALEAEFEIKRTSARKAAAREEKATAIFQAIINTARAVVEALPNLWLAALVGALGAAQVAVIAAQPLPLARGAVFERPTLLQSVEIGEREREFVLPDSLIRQVIREEAGGEQRITMPVAVYISGAKFESEVVRVVRRSLRRGEITIPAAVVENV